MDGEGLHPTEDQVRAVVNPPSPSNITELVFLSGAAELLWKVPEKPVHSAENPLHEQLQRGSVWTRTSQYEAAFKSAKDHLLQSTFVVQYDARRPLRFACDTSPYGVAAVVTHWMDNGEEKLHSIHISYAYRGREQI